MLRGVSYLGKRAVSVDTLVSESETLCVLQVDQVFFHQTIVRRICLIIAGHVYDEKFPAAQNRTSVTRHEGRATEIRDSSLGRLTVGIHPQDRYGKRESFSENSENSQLVSSRGSRSR